MSTENNYVVLARKYRPKTFEQVVGQKHVIDAMKNSILNNSLHSVYLLSGTRGVGKTTIARIFTKAMNCENFAEYLEPCGKCSSCRESGEVNNPDLIEVDAASRTKVEDTRELIERMNYAPMYSRYKVFIIDEVHMLSTSSFNALLKTLEEPPEYGKFILCTTDPQKIPATVLSRCLHFHLKSFTPAQIEEQLRNILEQEGVTCDESNAAGIRALARAAHGSMRDCLSLTDQALAIGNRQIKDEVVFDMLGIANDEMATDLLGAILDGQLGQAIQELNNIRNNHSNWANVLDQLITTSYKMLVYLMQDHRNQNDVPYDSDLTPNITRLLNKRMQFNDNVSIINAINTIVDAFLQAKKGIDYSPDPYYLIYLAILRTVYLTEELNEQALTTLKVQELQPTNRLSPENIRGYEEKKFRKSEEINILISNNGDLTNSGRALDLNFNRSAADTEFDIDRHLKNIANLAAEAPTKKGKGKYKTTNQAVSNPPEHTSPEVVEGVNYDNTEIVDLQNLDPIIPVESQQPEIKTTAKKSSKTSAKKSRAKKTAVTSETNEEEDLVTESNLMINHEEAVQTTEQDEQGEDLLFNFPVSRKFDAELIQQAEDNISEILIDNNYLTKFKNQFKLVIANFYDEYDLTFKKLGIEKPDLTALNSFDKNKQEIESYLKVLEFSKTLDFSTILEGLSDQYKLTNLLYITKLLETQLSQLFIFSKDKFNAAWQQVLVLILSKIELLPAYNLVKHAELSTEDFEFVANSDLIIDKEHKQIFLHSLNVLKESKIGVDSTLEVVDKLENTLTQAFNNAGYTLISEPPIEGVNHNFETELISLIKLITNLMYLNQSQLQDSLF